MTRALAILIAVVAIGVGALDDIPHMHPVIQQ